MSRNRPKKNSRLIYIVAAVTVAIPSITAIADISALQKASLVEKSNVRPMEIKLKVSSRNKKICPTKAKFSGWIITDQPGLVSYSIEEQNGKSKGPFITTAVKSVQGGMAMIENTFEVTESINTKYAVVAHSNNGDITSRWEPFVTQCFIKLNG